MENTRISRLKEDGFTLVAVDESYFVQGGHSRSARGLVGTRSVVSYYGNHIRISMFGCIAEHGYQLFRTFTGTFKSAQFIERLEEIRCRFGKVAVLCGRWRVYTSKEVKQHLASHPDVEILLMSVGSHNLINFVS